MLSLISFILVCIGSINWFCIGILQFDFVAGIFGSQSNIFSRLIYTLVGVASIIVIANFATNKGKFVVSFKKANKEFQEYKDEKKEENLKKKKAMAVESSEDFAIEKENNEKKENADNEYRIEEHSSNCECDSHCDGKEKEDKEYQTQEKNQHLE